MAELEDAPWATKPKDEKIHPKGEELPDAPWASQQPGVLEDVAKGAVSGLGQGIIAIPGLPGDLGELLNRGIDKGLSAIGVQAPPLASSPFSSAGIQKQVEKVTGPFYQAQTPIGKGAQTAAQIAPMLVAGGEGLVGTLAKAAGAGAVSEGLGEGANVLKGHLPEVMQPWAEPVARAIGVPLGAGLPATARLARTPNPMTAEQAATVAAVKGKAPNFPMTAGQETDSPFWRGVEGRSGKFADLPEKQTEAFTRGTMQEMGVDGLATPENIAKGSDIGTEIGNIRKANEITVPEFAQLNTDINQIARKYKGVVGPQNAQTIADLQKEIKLGAANSPAVASMQGPRYNYMRQRLQAAIDGASTGDEKTVLSEIRQTMDEAFHRSITPDESARLKQLETQYANYNVLKNKSPTATASGIDTMTPKEVSSAVGSHFGNAAVNENRGTLAPWARNVSKVTQELPPPNTEGGPFTRLAGTAAGYLGGKAFGGDAPLVGGILGRDTVNDVVQFLKNAGAKAASTAPAQAYLKNQAWLPSPATTMDKATLARLLMTPPVKQLGPSDQSR